MNTNEYNSTPKPQTQLLRGQLILRHLNETKRALQHLNLPDTLPMFNHFDLLIQNLHSSLEIINAKIEKFDAPDGER